LEGLTLELGFLFASKALFGRQDFAARSLKLLGQPVELVLQRDKLS
jgi:hypothetical protein